MLMNILKKRLEELTETKRDCDYSLSNVKQSVEMGIPYQTFNKYINGKHSCSIYNLVKIADYYGCSTDYLLGRTEIKSQEEDVRKICEAIGFDEEVLNSLKSWTTHPSCCEYKPLVALIIKCLTKDSAEAIAQYCYSIFFKELLYKELLPFFKEKERSQKGANYHISFLDLKCYTEIAVDKHPKIW